MHIIRILRDYLGITQKQLARETGVFQADLSEMENLEPYGNIDKYQKVADYLGVTVHALVANDCRLIPLSFFETNAPISYKEASSYKNIANGRAGEEYVLEKEKERVAEFSIVLSKLIIPYFKMGRTPGFDILSFDENGKAIYIEVKTTYADRKGSVLLTQKEQTKAEQLFRAGKNYQIHSLTNWGKEDQTYTVFDYETLRATAKMIPTEYVFVLDPVEKMTGIAFHRQKAGMSQYELGDALGISQSKMCLYENKELPCPVTVLYKMARLLGTTIDELLMEYDAECA